MNFKEYIELHRNNIYSTICSYMPLKKPEEFYGIMRDYIDRQGSYRRPGLVMLSGQLFGASIDNLTLPAAAEQLSEEWILMQDDVEDDSDLRRGKPAAQKLYGWVHAINASNLGHMTMWKMLHDYTLKVGANKGKRMFDKFYDMLEYTVEGQHIENQFIHYTKDLSKVGEDFYMRVVESKTCYYTVYGPLQIGAIAADQPDSTLEMLKDIGHDAGVAFQITDDILDMIGDEKKFGKKNFGDLYEGKVTLMILHARDSATEAEKAKIDAIYKKKRNEKTTDEINFLKDIIYKYDSISYAKARAKQFGENAERKISEYKDRLPQNEYTDILISAMEELYLRKK
ncbi:MAG: polyprenyl synthetase family protein [Candidatus Micrarchaeia archaeon]